MARKLKSEVQSLSTISEVVDIPTTLPEIDSTVYRVAKLDKNKLVVGIYSTIDKEYTDGDFKIDQLDSTKYDNLFDAIGRPNYKVAEVPVFLTRPVFDENGEQVYNEIMEEFPVFEEVPVYCESGEHILKDEQGNPITEKVQVFETQLNESGEEIQLPKLELKPVKYPVYEEYQSGTKESIVLRTQYEKDLDPKFMDSNIKAYELTSSQLLMAIATQQTSIANLLMEVSKLKQQLK